MHVSEKRWIDETIIIIIINGNMSTKKKTSVKKRHMKIEVHMIHCVPNCITLCTTYADPR